MSSMLTLLGVGVFFAALIAGRGMKERAFASLSDEQKLAVLDAFSGQRIARLVPITVMVLLYLGVSMMAEGSSTAVLIVFWLGLLAYGGLSVALQHIRLGQLDLPRSYMRSWMLGRVMIWGGMGLMLAGLWLGGLR